MILFNSISSYNKKIVSINLVGTICFFIDEFYHKINNIVPIFLNIKKSIYYDKK